MKPLLMICLAAFAASAVGQNSPTTADEHRMHEPGANRRMQRGMGGGGGMGGMHSMLRHRYVMHEGLPAEYRDLVNPLPVSAAVLAEGRRVYAAVCSACHGESGAGDGPAGAALDPPPANIQQLPRMPMMSSDGYLYWTVAEGGLPIATAMPPFKQSLTPEEIWSVVTVLREGAFEPDN